MKKRNRAVILILALILSLGWVLPAFADASSSNISMSVSTRTVNIGDTVTVTVKLNGSPKLANFQGGIIFDKGIFECTGIVSGTGVNRLTVQAYDPDLGWTQLASSVQSSVAEANGNGKIGVSFQLSASADVEIKMNGSALFVATFTAKAAGTANFSLHEDSATYPAHGTYAYTNKSFGAVSVSVKNPPVTLRFDANGHGTAPSPQTVEYGEAPSKPSDPSADGWDFTGWFSDSACTSAFNFGAAMTSDGVAYAGWEKHHEHTMKATAEKAADCTHSGTIAYWTCTDCGKIYSDAAGKNEISLAQTVVNALGHDWKETSVVEADCTKAGKRTYTCSRCSETRTEEIPALGHDWVVTSSEEPTCDKGGSRSYSCSRCSETKTEDLAALGHDYKIEYTWNKDLSKVSATAVCSRDSSHKVTETASVVKRESLAICGKEGQISYTATFRNQLFKTQTKTETIPSTPHEFELTDGVEATCESEGNIPYYTCSVCGGIYKDKDGNEAIELKDTVIPALGHDMAEEPVWKWADDNSSATAEFYCSRCDKNVSLKAELSISYNVVTATARSEGSDKVFTDSMHIDSKDSKVSVEDAKNGAGNRINVTEDKVPGMELLTPDKALAAIDSEELKDVKLEELTVLWQRDINVPEGSGNVTLTFDATGIGENDELLVFHNGKEAGWKLIGYEKGSEKITVTMDHFSPVALVKRTVTPVKEASIDNSAGTFDIMSLISNKIFIAAAAAVIVILILCLVLFSKKGKHYK